MHLSTSGNRDLLVQTVVVMGSKPNPAFPSTAADVVITAKSSVEQGLVYRRKYGSKIVALVPWPEIETHDYVRNALIKSCPEEVVVLGDDQEEAISFVKNTLGLQKTKVLTLTYNERNFGLLEQLGIRKFFLMLNMLWIRGIKFVLNEAVYDILNKREMHWLSRSTGINGILYAMKRFPNAEKIIIVGVGLIGGGHFDGVGEFTDKSAKSDQIFMKYWPKEKKIRVSTTDENLHEIGGIPEWKGDVFYEEK